MRDLGSELGLSRLKKLVRLLMQVQIELIDFVGKHTAVQSRRGVYLVAILRTVIEVSLFRTIGHLHIPLIRWYSGNCLFSGVAVRILGVRLACALRHEETSSTSDE